MAEQKKVIEYLDHLKNDTVTNMQNPTCIACNECCSLFVGLTKEEYQTILAFVQSKEGKSIYQRAKNKVKRYYRKGTLYGLCPFTDDTTKKCAIYAIRPFICRDFHCSTHGNADQSKQHPYHMADFFIVITEKGARFL